MARSQNNSIDESTLTKGQVRKLNALRKSVGPEIAEKAFAEWLVTQPAGGANGADANAQAIAELLWPRVEEGDIRIPRGGYLVRRGRGRVIVEAAADEEE